MKLPFVSRAKYDEALDDIKIYKNQINAKKKELDSANQTIELLREETAKLNHNKKVSDTLKQKGYNKRRKEKYATNKKIKNLEMNNQKLSLEVKETKAENSKLKEEQQKATEIIKNYETELNKIKNKPTVEDLKYEKYNKINSKKLAGGKFSKSKKK